MFFFATAPHHTLPPSPIHHPRTPRVATNGCQTGEPISLHILWPIVPPTCPPYHLGQWEEVWAIASGTYMNLLVNYSFFPSSLPPMAGNELRQKVTGTEP